MLDDEERQILERGGPARLTLDELEQMIWAEQRRGDGNLKGLMESWLEWAVL